MKKAQYLDFIPENIAQEKSTGIDVYDNKNRKVGNFALQNLALPKLGTLQYRVGILSDIHISYAGAADNFDRALHFFETEGNVDFVCICGDITVLSQDEEWEAYVEIVKKHKLPIYPIGGNHDASSIGLTDAKFAKYTGFGTFYAFGVKNDVFVMMSQAAWADIGAGVEPFYQQSLQKIYETLEKNRNKRCFVFEHLFPWGGCGDPLKIYESNQLGGQQGQVIYSMMEHYKNALWFHGHSHQIFEMQSTHKKATYDHDRGCHSIHIPSLIATKSIVDGVAVTDWSNKHGQGYVMDVYPAHIVLRGRDFVTGRIIPLAQYCLSTKMQDIAAGTYTDSTDIIVT